ncbi:hypothetical protein ACGFQG_32240 [Nocardia fluminea]|uniref:hypothetical protein n=1 Tax=Nocardia fluminea TaxID=134984 RepID=UPI00371E04ED
MSTDPTALPFEQEKHRKKEEVRAQRERAVTLFTAGIASVVAAQGMYVMFSESLGMAPWLTFICFAFIELMVIASAMRARTSQLTTGSAGVDGIAMWVLTILSGVLAASHATSDLGLLILRLAAPLVAAWGWERSMALERRQLRGEEKTINWRLSPQRLLVRWGLADPTDRSTAEVAVERRLADLARAAHAVRLVRETKGGGRAERRAQQQLYRAMDKAAEDGVVLGEENMRDRLAVHMEGRLSIATLPNYQPDIDWADRTTRRSTAPSLNPINPAARAEFAELTGDLEREFAARTAALPARAEHGADSTARAGNDELFRARAEEAARAESPRAPRTDETVARAPRTDEFDANLARDEAAVRAETSALIAGREGDDTATVTAPRAPRMGEEWASAGAPTAAHSPAELATAHEPRTAQTAPDTDPTSAPRAELSDRGIESARAQDDTAHVHRAPRAVVSLVREGEESARTEAHRARTSRANGAHETVTSGALARAAEPVSRARQSDARADGHGPFDRVLPRAEAERFARAVSDRGLSKQPVGLLADIYARASQGEKPTTIATQVGLRNHSTVIRALDAVAKVMGPRAV